MRKFFSDKAGATFNVERPNFTYSVRKHGIELIFKLDRGSYTILNLQRCDKDKLILAANWNHYFNRIQNPDVQYSKIEKCCPTLAAILYGKDPDGIMHVRTVDEDGSKIDAFGIPLEYQEGESLLYCIDKELVETARTLVNKVLTVYHELYDNPPFPAWKTGLEEIWN